MAGWCVRREAEPYGLKKLGVETLKPILTRGVLLDIAGHEGTLWMKDNARFDGGAPGSGEFAFETVSAAAPRRPPARRGLPPPPP